MPTTKDAGIPGDIWLMLPDGSEHALRCDVTIGRGEENDLILKTTTVSREHARVTHKEGRWFVEDLGSRNGTFVNAKRIPSHRPYALHHADRIDIGSETIDVPADLRAALGNLVGARLQVTLAVSNPNRPVTVTAPASAPPYPG